MVFLIPCSLIVPQMKTSSGQLMTMPQWVIVVQIINSNYVAKISMRRKNTMQQPQQLDLFQLQQEYPKEIVQNPSLEIDLEDLDVSKNVLICNVKKDNTRHFLNGTAKIYYTGRKFPSTIALNKLFYFMPNISKQRIRVVL